jgi:hypothetical protein
MKQEVTSDEKRNITSQWKFLWAKAKKGSMAKAAMEKVSLNGN